jgi:type IV pilus assembly protein PilM
MAFAAFNRVRSVGLLANSTLPIAIDFGVGALKVLQISSGEPHALVAAAQVDTPDDILLDSAKRFEFQSQALSRLIKAGGFKGKRAVCGIPAVQMFCKHLQFPKADGDVEAQVETALPAELGCHPDALVYRHVVVGELAAGPAAGKTEVICFAVPRDLIGRIMQLLKACKLEPVGIQPSCLAMMKAFEPAVGEAEANQVTLYLDMGTGATTCMIAHGKDLVFAKTIHLGGRHLDETIARQLKCNIAWARSQRLATENLTPSRTPGPAAEPALAGAAAVNGTGAAGPGPRLAEHTPAALRFDLSDALETLTDEVAMCLRYHDTIFPGNRVSKAIFVGGEARHRGLCQHIARKLRVPAQVADPLARLGRTGTEPVKDVDLTQPQPAWAVALGLCLSPTDI